MRASSSSTKVRELEQQAQAALSRAKFRLVMANDARSAFFALLVLRLTERVMWELPTCGTDGRVLGYNPEFVCSLSQPELQGVLAHEVLHCALGHVNRAGQRHKGRWNIAADLSINPLLLEAKFTLPEGRLMPGKDDFSALPSGLLAEEYYDLLASLEPDEEDPGRCGGLKEPDSNAQPSREEIEAEWQIALAQAEQVAMQRGSLPAGLARLVSSALRPKVNWKSVLREFLRAQSRNDHAWSPPSKRFVHAGLYLPGLRSEELGKVVIYVDTSGSIIGPILDTFAAEAQAALEAYDCTATIAYHDTQIAHEHDWCPSDGPLVLEPKGGGGTSHLCVFEHLEKMADPPSCVLLLTDLFSEFPGQSPDVPTLWCVAGNPNGVAPFGQTLHVE